jgi:diguanylate cyclase (GGDEF)-like protein
MTAAYEPFGQSPALRRAVTIAAIATSLVVAVIDTLIAHQLSLSAVHVLTVVAASWYGGLVPALAIAGVAVADAALHTARSGASEGLGLVVTGGLIEFTVLTITALAIARVRRIICVQAHRARHDSLTGALSRGAFQHIAERELRRVSRHGGPVSVAYFDIDDFKVVNDTRGHAEGDRVLRLVADSVVRSVRAGDAFARVGGDEFVLLLPDADAVDAAGVVRRVVHAVRAAPIGGRSRVGLSVGVATFREPPEAVHDMVTHADELMYRAKHAGGDRVVGAVIHPASTPWPVDVSLAADHSFDAASVV